MLIRRQTGRAFLYSAALTRAQLQAQIAGGVLSGLLQGRDGATAPLLSNFVESVSAQDGGAELLRELEDLVKQKRRQLAKDQKRLTRETFRRRPCTRPRPLEVETAEPAVHIEHLAHEKQSPAFPRLHRRGIDLIERNTPGRRFGVAVAAAVVHAQRQLRQRM